MINYDIPFDSEAYIHRIGRTGRAGRSGEAILFVNHRERHLVSRFERAVGKSIERMDIPNNEVINKSRINKLQQRLIKAAETGREHEEESKLLNELIQKVTLELNDAIRLLERNANPKIIFLDLSIEISNVFNEMKQTA